MGYADPNEYDNFIYSRSVIRRIDELIDSLDVPEAERDEDEAQELIALEALAKEGEQFSEWEIDVTLVRDTYFTDYVQELAEDVEDICDYMSNYIDWKRYASDMQRDYTPVEFSGVTYWGRS